MPKCSTNRSGDAVAPGDVIGAVSDAGGAPPQLYFEIREGRKPVDPKAWLKSESVNQFARQKHETGGQTRPHVCCRR